MFPNDMLSSLWALRPCVHHIKSNNAYTETKAFTLLLKKQATLSNKQLSSKKNHYLLQLKQTCANRYRYYTLKKRSHIAFPIDYYNYQGVVNLPANPNPHQSARRTFDCAPQSRCAIWIPRGDQHGGVFDLWSLLNSDRTSRFSNRKIL